MSTTTQLNSEFAADDFVPFIATKARAAIASSPSANTAMRLLLTGFKTSAGSMTAGTVSSVVTSEAECDALAGVGSELSRMYRAARMRTKDVEMWLGCVAEPSGVQAFARLTISGTWSEAGSIILYVDGDPLIVEIGASDATTAVATSIDTANALYPSLSYTTAVDGSSVDLTKNNKGTRGNSSILYVDTTSAPSGLVVTLEPPLGELVTLTAELRADFLAHIVLTTGTVHGAADVEIYAMGAAPTNHATAIARLGQLLVAAKVHVQKTAGGVHGASDSTALSALNALTAPTTGAEAVLFANAFKAAFFGAVGHSTRTTSSIHGAADTTNTIASADATDGAVTGDDVTGSGVRFAGGTGTEDVSTLISAIEADDLWFKRIVVSSLDVTNLGRWEVFADVQNGPMVGKPSALILGHVGTQAAAIAISKTQLNHEAFEVLHGYDWETPAAEFAACHAIDRVLTERAGPEAWNVSYSGSILPGVKPARDKSKRAVAHSTQKAALQNGLTPLTTTAAGETQIVRAIWSRCQNADGSPNYLGLDVAEWTVLQEIREMKANTWKFWRVLNPKVRDNFGKEPTIAGVATPDGWRLYWFAAVGQPMVAAGVFESLPTLRAAYNRTTHRIQSETDYTRMALHEQSEAVVTSLG